MIEVKNISQKQFDKWDSENTTYIWRRDIAYVSDTVKKITLYMRSYGVGKIVFYIDESLEEAPF